MSSKEECVGGMEQRLSTKDAAVKDVEAMLGKEECALGMGQRSNYVAAMDAQTKL